MDKITVYQKPTCSKCRELFKKLKEQGIHFDSVDYYVQPITREKLTGLIRKMGIPARDLLRTKESIYREINPTKETPSEEIAIQWMVEHPDLIQRPIVEKGERAVLARPLENLKKII